MYYINISNPTHTSKGHALSASHFPSLLLKTIPPKKETSTMNNLDIDKTFEQPDLTLHRTLFLAIQNVENAMRLFVHDHLNSLLLSKDESKHYHTATILTIRPLKQKLDQMPPMSNHQLYWVISNHLSIYENKLKSIRTVEHLLEPIEVIFYLIHQAYLEHDKSNLQVRDPIITEENELFEDYFRSQLF